MSADQTTAETIEELEGYQDDLGKLLIVVFAVSAGIAFAKTPEAIEPLKKLFISAGVGLSAAVATWPAFSWHDKSLVKAFRLVEAWDDRDDKDSADWNLVSRLTKSTGVVLLSAAAFYSSPFIGYKISKPIADNIAQDFSVVQTLAPTHN